MGPTFKLMGGLGNQLFIYAAALYLSTQFHQRVTLDPQFAPGSLRGDKHHEFSSSLDELFLDDRVRVSPNRDFTKNWLLNLLCDARQRLPKSESSFLLTLDDCGGKGSSVSRKSIYVRGYFQDHRFLEKLKVSHEWTTPEPRQVQAETENLRDRILESSGAVVHVRKGDYRLLRGSFGELGVGYYIRALDFIQNSDSRTEKIFVFSDDIKFVEDFILPELKVGYPVELVTPLSSPEQDLHAMSFGSSFVLANSSFSWWAASLRSIVGSTSVVYPRPWFRNAPYSDHLIPPSWIPLDADWEHDV